MNPSLLARITEHVQKYNVLSKQLEDPQLFSDRVQMQTILKERAKLKEIVDLKQALDSVEAQMEDTCALKQDPEWAILAEEEWSALESHRSELLRQLKTAFLPENTDANKACFVEIRAGTGGSEAALFAKDLQRMYLLYAEQQKLPVELISQHLSEQGGLKESILKVNQASYAYFTFESGGHRVQRVPKTEAQGRVHTSTCTVVVLPEAEPSAIEAIKASDLQIDTYRSSGAGGQHVNKTESAIRITHIPSGLVVACQEGRSQHQNRLKAMQVLASRLEAASERKQKEQAGSVRRNLLSSGERSDRIRTYNFAQGRVTDHRIGLTLYRLEDILEGHLELLVTPLKEAEQTAALAEHGLESE